MANRDTRPKKCNLPEVVDIVAKIVFDANIGTAAITDATEVCDIYNHHGYIASHERTAEGTFKFFLTDRWTDFAGMEFTRVKDADCQVICLAADVSNATATSRYIQVAFQTAGSDADPDGETVYLTFKVLNSTTGKDAP